MCENVGMCACGNLRLWECGKCGNVCVCVCVCMCEDEESFFRISHSYKSHTLTRTHMKPLKYSPTEHEEEEGRRRVIAFYLLGFIERHFFIDFRIQIFVLQCSENDLGLNPPKLIVLFRNSYIYIYTHMYIYIYINKNNSRTMIIDNNHTNRQTYSKLTSIDNTINNQTVVAVTKPIVVTHAVVVIT